ALDTVSRLAEKPDGRYQQRPRRQLRRRDLCRALSQGVHGAHRFMAAYRHDGMEPESRARPSGRGRGARLARPVRADRGRLWRPAPARRTLEKNLTIRIRNPDYGRDPSLSPPRSVESRARALFLARSDAAHAARHAL